MTASDAGATQQALAHYHRNEFMQAADAYDAAGGHEGMVAKLRSFGEAGPYLMDGPPSCELEFVQTDPLPVVRLLVEGRETFAIIDTGGGELIIDDEFAAEVGAKRYGSFQGTFGGGLQAEVHHGSVDRVVLGEVVLRGVPVQVLSTRRFSPITGGRWRIDAVVGTNLLAQFLPTLDYPEGKLVLRARGGVAPSGVEVPFELRGTHYMVAQGSFNDVAGLSFFVDSGLAGGAFMCGRELLERAGVAVPEAKVPQGGVGGGGGKFAAAPFRVDELTLGPLRQTSLQGVYVPGQRLGFDGLISHGFLRRYSWTIDFDRSVYTFTEA